jgi:hypothetical protein
MRVVSVCFSASGTVVYESDVDQVLQQATASGTGVLILSEIGVSTTDVTAPSVTQVRDDILFCVRTDTSRGAFNLQIPLSKGRRINVAYSAIGTVCLFFDTIPVVS